MGPVLTWPRILAVTSGPLYKHKINFLNYTEDSERQLSVRDVLITITAESL